MAPAPTEELETLMRRALAGDREAYARALSETANRLRPFLARRIASRADAEDVLQEILISIHKSRHTYDGERPFMPWAFAIARFRLKDWLRAHYADRLRASADLSEAEIIAAGDVTESGLSYESIRGEVEKLPQKQATILQLLHQEGYTAREAAEKIGMTETAVKVAAHRAYKVLRKKLM